MTPIYQERINEFFDCYNHFLSLPPDQFIRGKTQICLNVKQCVIRYLYEIHVWGTTEDYKQEPEVIQHMRETFGNIFKNILNTFQSNDENLTIAAFDALKQLARSSDKNFFVDNEILISLCQSVLIPCIQLDPEDVNSFDSEPLKYFAKDIDGVEGSKRNNAYDFLKTLCRNFRQQLQMVFIPYSNDLLQKYQADPLNNWVQMDTAIFIMGAIATETQLVRQGVTKVAEGFDLEGFVNQFIIPQLNPQNQFPILQTDSLKFIVDFRSILKPIIPNIFVIVQNLLLSSQSPAVTFYSAYCMERLMFSQSNDPEVLNVMMTQVNLQAIVNRLFEIFVYDKELNVQASKCLMRIVTTGHPNVIPLIPFIIKTTTDYIRRLCGNPLNPNFTHCLFEILVASVTRLNVDVKLIEPPVLDLLNVIISENVTDFVPYVFQIIGTYLLSYPPNVEVNPFYATQFEFFLNPQLWQPQGNVPALSILVRAYIIRIPELVANFSSQILFICQGLLQMPRAHKYAFEIFENIFRFMEHNGSVNLFRQIQPLIIQQIGNPDLVQFQQSFSVFMAKAAYYLGADEFLSNLNPMPDFIEAWGKALSIMRGREYLKCILAGVLKVLLEATIIPPELWEHLFISLLMMFEAPSDDYYKEMHQSSKQATVEAMEFDTTFNKLVYSDIPQLKEFQELDGADLVKFMYVNLAGWSQSHPGVIQAIVQNKLPPKIQSTFVSYCKSYEIQFY
ncbi:Importin-beta N-terminal domain containing protein [Histomonas meleagridis]|nr:Importin-beta N-terminal domain containing protein [Histomonas meleagridis]